MLVVARSLDGRRIKGRSTDFHPARRSFRVAAGTGHPPVEVPTDGLKAVFFVRSLDGNPERQDHRQFPRTPGQARQRIWLEFKDGERMAGWPISTPLGREGFYVIPTDPTSNVEKAYVFRDAVAKLLQGDEAIVASAQEQERLARAVREPTVLRVL